LKTPAPVDFVVVGHVCQDLLPDGSLGLGGSVSYAATTACRLGCRVGVVTSTGPDLDLRRALPGIEIVSRPTAATTLFENIYFDGKRKQILHRRADVITCDQIPLIWRSAPMVYLGSIDQEIDPDVFHCFADEALIGVMPQGFFRGWDQQGRVFYTEWNPPEAILRRMNLLVISELDVPDPVRLATDWGRFIETIVVTRAERGATTYHRGEPHHDPARPAQQVDPTGAGDVFAAAFLIRLAETGDPSLAAPFANAVASFSVEGPGMTGIPQRAQVEAYMQAADARFGSSPRGPTQWR
jgi:sugar/nucleoside kinase (ribokinase family)